MAARTRGASSPGGAGAVLRPARPQLAAARAAAQGYDDPAEAWEALAARGLVPLAWVEDQRRWYGADEAPERTPAGAHYTLARVAAYLDAGPAPVSHPPTVRACIALASDPEGVLTAEALAVETVRRLAPWGAPQPACAAWRVVDPSRWQCAPGAWRHLPAAHAAAAALRSCGARDRREPRSAAHDYGTPAWHAAHAADCEETWQRAAAAGGTVLTAAAEQVAKLGQPRIPRALWDTPLANLANPFTPLVALWSTGYALDAVTEHALVLVAPALAGT